VTKDLALVVNDTPVNAAVEPRVHLADFLRGELGLTGTHLGCEQGVCGACTVVIDGKPARSCITYAVACAGAKITTIEGFDDDPLMRDLREAFAAHHGLQCGFCTPGMLIAARDLILRRGECDEAAIREELSGNLCRCTGYMGIIAAVKAASTGRKPQDRVAQRQPEKIAASVVAEAAPLSASPASVGPSAVPTGTKGWTELAHRTTVAADPATTWRALKDVPRVAACLPGAEVESYDGHALRGRITVKFGPIKASFAGNGTVAFDDATRTGVVRGAGRDTRSGSQARGEVAYAVVAAPDRSSTLEIRLCYRLTGALAQFSRGALVSDFVAHLAELFARNLAQSIAEPAAKPASGEMTIVGVLWAVLLRRLRSAFTK
jgi:carbon-monoxide dehydrogenase small subunit